MILRFQAFAVTRFRGTDFSLYGKLAPNGQFCFPIQMIHATRLRWLILTLFVVFLDRLSKAAIEARTTEGWRHELVHNFVYLVHSKNPGIAFSILAHSSSPWVRYLLVAGSLVVIAILAWYLVAANGVSSRVRSRPGITSRRRHRQSHRSHSSRRGHRFLRSALRLVPLPRIQRSRLCNHHRRDFDLARYNFACQNCTCSKSFPLIRASQVTCKSRPVLPAAFPRAADTSVFSNRKTDPAASRRPPAPRPGRSDKQDPIQLLPGK